MSINAIPLEQFDPPVYAGDNLVVVVQEHNTVPVSMPKTVTSLDPIILGVFRAWDVLIASVKLTYHKRGVPAIAEWDETRRRLTLVILDENDEPLRYVRCTTLPINSSIDHL